jgi:hypothetical protein
MKTKDAAMSNALNTANLTRILDLREDDICDFMRDAMNSKRLSQIVKDLNDLLLDGAPEQKAKASQALSRLGFPLSI